MRYNYIPEKEFSEAVDALLPLVPETAEKRIALRALSRFADFPDEWGIAKELQREDRNKYKIPYETLSEKAIGMWVGRIRPALIETFRQTLLDGYTKPVDDDERINLLTGDEHRMSPPGLTAAQHNALLTLLEGKSYSEHITYDGREYFTDTGALWVVAWRGKAFDSGDILGGYRTEH